MTLPVIDVDVMMAHPGGICPLYTRDLVASFFDTAEFTAIEILTTRPDHDPPITLQDRLYHILRVEVVPQQVLDAVCEWVDLQAAEINAISAEGQAIQGSIPLQQTAWQKSDLFCVLLTKDSLSEAPFRGWLLSLLEVA